MTFVVALILTIAVESTYVPVLPFEVPAGYQYRQEKKRGKK